MSRYPNKVYFDQVRGRWTVTFTKQALRKQYNSEEEAREAAGLPPKPKPEPADTKAGKKAVTSESGRVRNAVSSEAVETEAQTSQAKQISTKISDGGVNKTTGPFKSVGERVGSGVQEQVKNTKEAGKNFGKRKKQTPAFAQMKAPDANLAVYGAAIISSPSSKNSIDTLAGSATAASVNLKKVTGDNSPEAISSTLEQAISVEPNIVRQEVAKVQLANQNQPALKEGLKNFPESIKTSVSAELLKDLPKVAKTDLSLGIANKLSEFSGNLNKELGNPFGALNSPFGQIGMDFGNILGSVVGSVMGQGPFQAVGQVLNLTPDGIDPKSLLPAPPIVNSFGDTQLNKTVRTQQITAVEQPTLPATDLTKQSEPQDLADFEYKIIVDKKSLELMLQSVTSRTIDSVIFGWTKNFSDEDESASIYNTKVYAKDTYKATASRKITDLVSQTHIYIQKSGRAKIILPFKTIPRSLVNAKSYRDADQADQLSKQELYDRSIVVRLDAGFKEPKSAIGEKITEFKEENKKKFELKTDPGAQDLLNGLLSSDSITAEQWKTVDMIVEIITRLNPGGTITSASDLHEDIAQQNTGFNKFVYDTLGIRFDMEKYAEKFK